MDQTRQFCISLRNSSMDCTVGALEKVILALKKINKRFDLNL